MLDHDEAADKGDASSDKLSEVHARAMRRFDAAVQPQIDVREQSLQARRFATIPGAQWDGDFGEQFDNSIKMEINKVGRAVRKAETDYRQNRIVPDFRPSGGESDNDTADTLDGLHRADSYHFKAQQARDNAFSEAVRGGFGAWRLTTEYADPLDKDSDEQRINPAMLIADADQCVFFDPDSTLYDKSDARYAFVLTGASPEAFADKWGDDKCSSWPEGVIKPWYDWFRPDRIVQAEYYEIEDKAEILLIFTLPATGEEQRHWQRDLAREDRGNLTALGWKVRERRIERQRCHKYALSGSEVLEDQGLIVGGNIPIVPVYCYRDFVDGIERFKGIVQDKIDAQRLYNSNVSRLAEINAMAPYERPIFDPEQLPPGLQNLWARGNIDRHPYALANALRQPDGTIIQAGPIGKVEPPSVPQTTAALLEISNRDLIEDDEDGADQVVANTSADAMDIAAARVDAKSGLMLDNMRQSVQREGELYLDAACEVYVEDGREVETMTEEGDDGSATLNESFYDNGTLKTRNDFASGRYKVIASVTEATATRRDRTVKSSLGIAEIAMKAGNNDLANASLLTAVMNQDGEGIEDLHRYARKQSLQIGLSEPTEDEQKQAAEDAQAQQQQPDPAKEVAAAQVSALNAGATKDAADAQLAGAKVVDTLAAAGLKRAQAMVVGGPESAPEVPTGLTAANDTAQVQDKFASADLKRAQAEHLRHDMGIKRIKTGAEIEALRQSPAA